MGWRLLVRLSFTRHFLPPPVRGSISSVWTLARTACLPPYVLSAGHPNPCRGWSLPCPTGCRPGRVGTPAHWPRRHHALDAGPLQAAHTSPSASPLPQAGFPWRMRFHSLLPEGWPRPTRTSREGGAEGVCTGRSRRREGAALPRQLQAQPRLLRASGRHAGRQTPTAASHTRCVITPFLLCPRTKRPPTCSQRHPEPTRHSPRARPAAWPRKSLSIATCH